MDRTILTCKEFVRNTAEMGPPFVEPVTDTIEMIFDEMVKCGGNIFNAMVFSLVLALLLATLVVIVVVIAVTGVDCEVYRSTPDGTIVHCCTVILWPRCLQHAGAQMCCADLTQGRIRASRYASRCA